MIKVTIGESKTQNKLFPKLMVGSKHSIVVLFIDSTSGTCLHPGLTQYRIGEYSKYWDGEQFVDFNEPITLQNA